MQITFKNAIIKEPPKKKKITLKQIFKKIKILKPRKRKLKY